jgi:cytochrome c-type biogenesis protein
MEGTPNVSIFLAFSAGFLSFVSPCVLPLVPSYVSFITGLSMDELTSEEGKRRARQVGIKNSLMFILGFSVIFITLGASATMIGRFSLTYQGAIRRFGGLLVIFFGLYVMGLIKPSLLMRDTRLQLQSKPAGYLGSFLVGIAFAAGWTPCVGPILGTILLYASGSNSIWSGMGLLTAYSIGLGLPLFISSLSVQSFLFYFKKTARYMWVVSGVSGIFLVAVGILIFTNSLTRLTSFFSSVGIGWTIGQ